MTLEKPKIAETAYHKETRNDKSKLLFVHNEMHFLGQLLRSYIFEPSTPNLYERLEGYKTDLDHFRSKYDYIETLLTGHDNELGGLMECETEACETAYDEKHLMVLGLLDNFLDAFNELKSKIFNYCGGILKQHKK